MICAVPRCGRPEDAHGLCDWHLDQPQVDISAPDDKGWVTVTIGGKPTWRVPAEPLDLGDEAAS